MEKEGRASKGHVLVLPCSIQGHINPMLQFSKRLASKGLRVTIAITIFASKSMRAKTGPVRVETISDGFDEGFEAGGPHDYMERFKIFGSRTLSKLIEKEESRGDPIDCVIYDPFLDWALDVAKQFNLLGAMFFTQSCAVNSIYYHFQRGLLNMPVSGPIISTPGLPELGVSDLPSFFSVPGSYPSVLTLLLDQFSNINKADWVFVNTFDKLEHEVVNRMAKLWSVRTIGPTVPSMYLDKRVEGDKDYGLDLFEPSSENCMDWLNAKETGSVVYVSFGTLAVVTQEQMGELAWGLRESNYYFLWVVRDKEKNKLPSNFTEETSKGLLVSWCPQLEVLSHKAVGCFVTHCGWNSTLEALSLGVPIVGLPQWTDQPTNAKCLEDVWGVGLRARRDDNGIVRKEDIVGCIREVMEGERQTKIKRNANKWKELAREAVDEGGSSDKNIEEFVSRLACT